MSEVITPLLDGVQIGAHEVTFRSFDKGTPIETWDCILWYRPLRVWLEFPRKPSREQALEEATRILSDREAFGCFLITEGTRAIDIAAKWSARAKEQRNLTESASFEVRE